jgi:O-methyltransferase involved in polyketide biosynthesis
MASPIQLDAVPETLLWTLYHRAVEARRPDRVLDDPLAVELVERIDYPFAERFGDGRSLAQWQARRARAFDDRVAQFLAASPGGTVVALGEGLETQSWRVDDGQVRWVTVDLPEVIELRSSLLPRDGRRRLVAGNVADEAWFGEIGSDGPILFTAQGVLMYLEPADVHALVARVAGRFGGSGLIFDAIPPWLSERSRAGRLGSPSGYHPPPWRWALDRRERDLLAALPQVASLRRVAMRRGRGVAHGYLLPLAARVPLLGDRLLSIWDARFGSG